LINYLTCYSIIQLRFLNDSESDLTNLERGKVERVYLCAKVESKLLYVTEVEDLT
jgi:hypothetical protein